MEPGLRDRENGLRAVGRTGLAGAAMEPGLRDRENPFDREFDTVAGNAAMEPGLRDRENAEGAPGPRARENVTQGNVREAVRTGRNGARPERPGKRRIRGGTCPAQVRRNGARPERPGKLECRWDHPTDRDAAMEPGLRDRENRRRRSAQSPRGRSRNGARPERPGKLIG